MTLLNVGTVLLIVLGVLALITVLSDINGRDDE